MAVFSWDCGARAILPAKFLARKSLCQFELDNFHVFRPVENPVRVSRFHEKAQPTET